MNAQAPKINPELEPFLVAIDALHEDPRNARRHNEKNLAALKESLARFGQQKPIAVTKDGEIVAGNGTYRTARALGWSHVAAVVFDGDAKQARAYAIADNRTAELATWDEQMLGTLLDEMTHDDENFTSEMLGFSDAEYMKLIGGLHEDPTMDEDEVEPQGSPIQPGAENAAPSHVRMVQLFLNADNHPPFMGMVKDLGGLFETSTVTDTVLKAVEDAHARAVADKRLTPTQ